jgi:hypothetical protein
VCWCVLGRFLFVDVCVGVFWRCLVIINVCLLLLLLLLFTVLCCLLR